MRFMMYCILLFFKIKSCQVDNVVEMFLWSFPYIHIVQPSQVQGLGRQARPMGQWSQSLNINGPFLKSMGHWSKLMGQLQSFRSFSHCSHSGTSDHSWLLCATCIFQSNLVPRALLMRGCVVQSEKNGGSGYKIIMGVGNVFEIVLIKQRIKV